MKLRILLGIILCFVICSSIGQECKTQNIIIRKLEHSLKDLVDGKELDKICDMQCLRCVAHIGHAVLECGGSVATPTEIFLCIANVIGAGNACYKYICDVMKYLLDIDCDFVRPTITVL